MPKIYNNYEIQNAVVKIFLKDDIYCIIDLNDFLRVMRCKWHFSEGYVKNSSGNFLHRYIMNCPEEKIIDHINHNTLDNRKSNLRICNNYENGFNRLGACINSYTGDKPILDEEFERQLKLKEFLKNSFCKFEYPKLTVKCCNYTQSANSYDTYQAFRCYLHFPLKNMGGKIKFSITYRFQCLKCGCIKLFTYNYDKHCRLIKVDKANKTKIAITRLNQINNVLIKEMGLPERLIFKKYLSRPKSHWYYGVPINENLFKKVSLNGEEAGLVSVGA